MPESCHLVHDHWRACRHGTCTACCTALLLLLLLLLLRLILTSRHTSDLPVVSTMRTSAYHVAINLLLSSVRADSLQEGSSPVARGGSS